MRTLHALPPEPWGYRLRRARESVAGLTLRDAVVAMDRYQVVSTATLSRLESFPTIPLDRRHLRTAFVACLVYEVDPAELGLDPDGLALLEGLPGAIKDALTEEFFATTSVTSRFTRPQLIHGVAA